MAKKNEEAKERFKAKDALVELQEKYGYGVQYVHYTANNSGGRWWLTTDKWKALERAGWFVPWVREYYPKSYRDADGSYMGTEAHDAYLVGATLKQAIVSFEEATGARSSELGCSCCGPPHYFEQCVLQEHNGHPIGHHVDSYSPSYPYYGDEYDG